MNSIPARCFNSIRGGFETMLPITSSSLVLFHSTDRRLWRNLRRQQWRRSEVDIRRHRWRHIRRIIHGRSVFRRVVISVLWWTSGKWLFSNRASGVHPHQKNRETKNSTTMKKDKRLLLTLDILESRRPSRNADKCHKTVRKCNSYF